MAQILLESVNYGHDLENRNRVVESGVTYFQLQTIRSILKYVPMSECLRESGGHGSLRGWRSGNLKIRTYIKGN